MAEFCLTCWNEINKLNLTEKEIVLSAYDDFCEGCNTFRPIIIRYKLTFVLKGLFKQTAITTSTCIKNTD